MQVKKDEVQEIKDARIKVSLEKRLLCLGVVKIVYRPACVLPYEKKEAHSGLKYTPPTCLEPPIHTEAP